METPESHFDVPEDFGYESLFKKGESGRATAENAKGIEANKWRHEHIMNNHRDYDARCSSCRAGSSRVTPARRVDPSRQRPVSTCFGNLVGDHFIAGDRSKGYDGSKVGFVVRDRYTGKRECFPAAQEATPDILEAYTDFAAGKKIHEVTSDCSHEVALANKEAK